MTISPSECEAYANLLLGLDTRRGRPPRGQDILTEDQMRRARKIEQNIDIDISSVDTSGRYWSKHWDG